MKTFSMPPDDAALVPLVLEIRKHVSSDVLKVWCAPWCPLRLRQQNVLAS